MFLIGVVAAFVELIVLINVLNVNSPTETVKSCNFSRTKTRSNDIAFTCGYNSGKEQFVVDTATTVAKYNDSFRMAAQMRAPKQWSLTKQETITSFERVGRKILRNRLN